MFYIGNSMMGKAVNDVNNIMSKNIVKVPGEAKKEQRKLQTTIIREIPNNSVNSSNNIQSFQKQSTHPSIKLITIIIFFGVFIWIVRFIWKINIEYHSGTADREKRKNKERVKRYYQKRNYKNSSNKEYIPWLKPPDNWKDPEIWELEKKANEGYKNDNRIQGEITRFKRPDALNAPKVVQQEWPVPVAQETQEAITWTKPFLRSIEWKRYEEVCMEYLRIKNCQANVTYAGADGGIDIKISDNNDVVFAAVQCKAWEKPIGVNLIRELYGVMAADRIKTGIFLTTSEFTNDALAFAKGKNLLLIDCDELIRLINGLDDANKKRINLVATEGDYSTPTCVSCDVKMIKRTVKNGNNSGRQFWGCVNFPRCKNTMVVK